MNSSDSTKIVKHLGEQLNQLSEGARAPDELKDEVFNTLDTLVLLGDVVDLFTLKFSHSEVILLGAVADSFGDEILNKDSLDEKKEEK